MTVISSYIIPPALAWQVKFLIIAGGTYLITFALYEGIRRTNFLRYLFGLKTIS